MRHWAIVALATGLVVALTWQTAEAQSRKRTKLTVTKRSYLDAGTQVKPGERKFTDYVFPPNYSPSAVFDPSGVTRFSLPRPWDLPGFTNGGVSF